jgi:hypothetical protein
MGRSGNLYDECLNADSKRVLIEASVQNFKPSGPSYHCTDPHDDVIAIEEIEPVVRTVLLDANGFGHDRMLRVLSAIRDGVALPPIPVKAWSKDRKLTGAVFATAHTASMRHLRLASRTSRSSCGRHGIDSAMSSAPAGSRRPAPSTRRDHHAR